MPSLNITDMTSRAVPMAKKKKWIQKADLKKAAFTKKADAAGESVHEHAEKEKDAPGKTGKQARLALAFEGMAHKKKSRHARVLYDRS